MKACIFAVLVLVGADLAANHGAMTHRFFAGVSGVGLSIGEWVYY